MFTINMTDDTWCTVEHPKAVSMVMTKELADYNVMMFLNKLDILFIELRPEPWFMSFLLKKPRGNVTDNVHLNKGESQYYSYEHYTVQTHIIYTLFTACQVFKMKQKCDLFLVFGSFSEHLVCPFKLVCWIFYVLCDFVLVIIQISI